jgi:hypothetical protein
MTANAVKWTKIGTGRWEAVVDGKKLTVTRVIRQRSWSYDPGWVCIGRKPRRYQTTAIVSAYVRIGDEWHHLTRLSDIYTVKDAKAAAIRYATTGEGKATITRVGD